MERERNGSTGQVGDVLKTGRCKVSTMTGKTRNKTRQVDIFIKKPSGTKPITLHFSQQKIAVSTAVTGLVRFLPLCESVNLMLRIARYLWKSVSLTS